MFYLIHLSVSHNYHVPLMLLSYDSACRQFKIYRESKEKELQALLKEKRHLETTVRSRRISLTVTDDENNTWWPDSEPSLGII